MAGQVGLAIMSSMRTMVIVATVALGAFQFFWRALSRPEPLDSAMEWTADE
jgi:hypothetical protein